MSETELRICLLPRVYVELPAWCGRVIRWQHAVWSQCHKNTPGHSAL